ncbi:carbamoyl-phosphate synthase large subunit [Pricia antarctica]|uniref:Carbamoyl-phosphate synthase large subunit n=1 Tax=Pricia antarctica TaxID=641691 RepID=A0A1G7FK24_9FLAO|nr:ATP-grasp domain-containing protein [Pricia antarctica]SDE76212.1 carbamoyl-phosphate synthase large subunit [Pricia antarctica]
MNILISSAGRRVSLVRAFQKELQKVYPQAKVFASDANPQLSGACHVADGYFKVPKVTHPDYPDALIQQCKACDIQLLIPTIDAELLPMAINETLFAENGLKAVIASEGFVEKCRDKRQIHQFFESQKVAFAHEYAKDDYKLPLFIKPIDGSRSIDTYVIKDEAELTDYHFANDKLMFLEYLDHNCYDEFTCDLYYGKDHALKCVVPRKRLEVRDGEVYKALTVANTLVPYIKEKLGYIEGAVGCLTSQFFKHKTDDNIYGIEINPRFGGGFPLSYLSGANYPKWIIQEFLLDEKIDDQFDCWEKDLLMIRYDDEILVHGYKG